MRPRQCGDESCGLDRDSTVEFYERAFDLLDFAGVLHPAGTNPEAVFDDRSVTSTSAANWTGTTSRS
jgi:hypothetical protein